ncbi:MAG TPA: RsmB/NOP family class I SAM-dependent RNA methyltransferase, partial [Streptosporangiaceae bacterium]
GAELSAVRRPAGAGTRGDRGRGPAGAGPARRVAFEVLLAVCGRDAYANLLLAAALREHGLTGQDAALATELVYGTLRNQSCYDAVIGLCADRDVQRIDPPVLGALRLGTHQLLGMRVRAHAAVATAVDLAVEFAGRRPSGFVNAVLRRVATRDLESWIGLAAPSRAEDLAGHLAVRYSHPRWIVTAFAAALGEAREDLGDAGGDPGEAGQNGAVPAGWPRTEAVLAADQRRPAVTIAAVPGLVKADDLIAEGAGLGAGAARWSPFGMYLDHGDPGALPAVAGHRAGVQDEASQLAALALARAEVAGEEGTWLDLCAGPGGKARLLGGLAAQRGARLVAADVHEHRARLVAGGLSVLPGARALAADGTRPAWRPAAFTRVLADVPCSGLGSLRRRPEARWRRGPDDLAGLRHLQRGLLASAIEATRPGGVTGYVTCSPHLGETREVLAEGLAGRDDVAVLDAPGLLPEVPELACPAPFERYAQFWPHPHGTDAIFVAVLRRLS